MTAESAPGSSAHPPATAPAWQRFRWVGIFLFLAAVGLIGFLLWNQRRAQPEAQAPLPQVIAPSEGGTYTEALIGAFGRLNPLFDHLNGPDRDVDRLLYRGLVQFDYQGIPRPDLAEGWGVARDGRTYNFALRRDAVWHDGTPITAADVLFTIELMRREDLPIDPNVRTLWQKVEVRALDDYTLQFQLPEPFAPFLDYLTFGILPKHVWEPYQDDLLNAPPNQNPIGNGPFRFDHFLVEEGRIIGVALRAFNDFYEGRPFIDEFVFRYYPSHQAAFQAYQQGEVMGIASIEEPILEPALHDPTLNIYTARLPRLTLIFFNLQSLDAPFLQDVQVRKALYLALNRKRMIRRVLHGQALLADSPIFPGTWAYDPTLPRVPYDPEQAQRLLDEAGYTLGDDPQVRTKDDERLELTLLHPDTEVHRALAQEIARDWTRIGVGVTLEAVPYDELLNDRLALRKYQAALVDLDLARSPDPDPYPFWHEAEAGQGGQNYSMWKNRRASMLLELARVTPDLQKRARLYHSFQRIFVEEWPALPLFYLVYNYGVSAQVKGVRLGPLFDPSDRFQHVGAWYLVARPQPAITQPVGPSAATPAPAKTATP